MQNPPHAHRALSRAAHPGKGDHHSNVKQNSDLSSKAAKLISLFCFVFFSGEKARDLARVTKNHRCVVYGPYFDPMTPPLGVLKSQNGPQLTLGAFQVGFLQYSRFRVL